MVAVEAAPNTRIIQSILTNRIDLGIVTQPSSSPELEYESLGIDSLCLVLPSDYTSHPITFDTLEEIGFIDHPDGAHYADRLLSANFGEQFHSIEKLRKKGHINQINQILIPFSKGPGYKVLPEMAVRHFPLQSSPHIAELKVPIYDELFLVRKKASQTAETL